MGSKVSELEKNALAECEKVAKKYGLKAEKVKVKRSSRYCLTLDGRVLLGSDDLVGFSEFCKNEKDVKLLAEVSKGN